MPLRRKNVSYKIHSYGPFDTSIRLFCQMMLKLESKNILCGIMQYAMSRLREMSCLLIMQSMMYENANHVFKSSTFANCNKK